MSSTNNGGQTIVFDYKQQGTSQGFNKLFHKLIPVGILKGGELTRITDASVSIAPMLCIMEDEQKEVTVRIETTTNATVGVSLSTPYVVCRFEWLNVEDNYMDFVACQYSEIKEDDIVIGKCIYVNNSLNGFDYCRKNWSQDYYNGIYKKVSDFRVTSVEPEDLYVHVNSGTAFIGGKKVTFTGGNAPVDGNVSQQRIDLVSIDCDGNIIITKGEQSETPKAPVMPSNMLTVAMLTLGSNPQKITGSMIENIYVNNSVESATNKIIAKEVSGSANTGIIETNDTYILKENSGNLTLGSASHDLTKITVANVRDTSANIMYNGQVVDTLESGKSNEYLYCDSKWTSPLNSALANYHIGMIIAFAGSTAPNGWFICDGREVSRTEYSRLFALIGVAYGNGNGTTTFNIPNLQDRFLQGASATNIVGTKKEAGLPNIKGFAKTRGANIEGAEGAIQNGWDSSCYFGSAGACCAMYIDASKGETKLDGTYKTDSDYKVYGKSDTVQPPSVCINYIIKY